MPTSPTQLPAATCPPTAPTRYERSANECLRTSTESPNRIPRHNHRQRRAQNPRHRPSRRSANLQNLTGKTIPQERNTKVVTTKAKGRTKEKESPKWPGKPL